MDTPASFTSIYTQLFAAYVGPMGAPTSTPPPPGISKLSAGAAAAQVGPNSPMLYINGGSTAFFATNQTLTPAPTTYTPPALTGGFAPGMVELAAVSHLGPAIGSLIQMWEIGTPEDREQVMNSIESLLALTEKAKKLNTASAWCELNPALCSYTESLVTLIDGGLLLINQYLVGVIAGTSDLSFDTFRAQVLNPPNLESPSFDAVMIATFALANLVNHYQVLCWLDQTITDPTSIPNMLVLISGTAGRSTAGLTAQTNPTCQRLNAWASSKGQSFKDRIYIISGGTTFGLSPSTGIWAPTSGTWASLEGMVRTTWWQTYQAVDLSDPMFVDYPAQTQPDETAPPSETGNPPLSYFMGKLKFVLGHPTQELASSTSSFILDALLKNDTNPVGLWIPGLSGR